jgi:HEAT repeat protein
LVGDASAEVVGQCLAVMLEIGRGDEVKFVGRFLRDPDDEVKAEAASVLAVSREEGAMEVLHAFWKLMMPEELRKSLLLSLGASPQRQAAELLVAIIEDGDEPVRRISAAREALKGSRYWREFAGRVE